jgi:hypothetical protein
MLETMPVIEQASVRAAGATAIVANPTSATFRHGWCAGDAAGLQGGGGGGLELRVMVPARLMLQFTWTGLDQVMAVYPNVSAALAAAGPAAGE